MSEELTESQKAVIKKSLGEKAKNVKSKEDNNIIYTSYLETKEYILEQILSAGVTEVAGVSADGRNSRFIKYSKLNGEIEEIESWETEGKTYKPVVDDALKMNGIYLPTGIGEYKDAAEITSQIREFINENCEVPSFFQKLFPYLILFYWAYHKFPFIPYLHFVGGSTTGKTTAMEVLGSISYKAIDTTGSLTIASLFRLASLWGGTLLIDEFDSIGEGMGEMISFLKAGVSNRLLFRTEGETKKEVKAYVVKSPKFFTSEHPISDAGLQSRTMVIKMNKSSRRLPLYHLPEFYEEATSIRNKLLLWRLRNLDKINLREMKYGFSELQAFDRRVQQIITPIYYFSDVDGRKEIVEFAKEQEIETQRERRSTLAGKIFEKIIGFWDTGQDAQIKTITLLLNGDNVGYKELTEKKISGEIRKVLGFDTEPGGHEKLSTVIREPKQEASQREYFGISPSI